MTIETFLEWDTITLVALVVICCVIVAAKVRRPVKKEVDPVTKMMDQFVKDGFVRTPHEEVTEPPKVVKCEQCQQHVAIGSIDDQLLCKPCFKEGEKNVKSR
jgi:Zn finger protein HypA/HybF involved in hydrogenase expression